MADFHTFEWSDNRTEMLNLDTVERIVRENSNGVVTIYFTSGSAMVLKGRDAESFMDSFVSQDDG